MRCFLLTFSLITLGCVLGLRLPAQGLAAEDLAAIRQVLADQQAAWNRADIPVFMEGYWRSDSLTFVGSRGVTYGWQETLEGYQKRYPDSGAMGKLDFDEETLVALGPASAMLIGRWHLTRSTDELGGWFTLIWKKINGTWVIISDHTS